VAEPLELWQQLVEEHHLPRALAQLLDAGLDARRQRALRRAATATAAAAAGGARGLVGGVEGILDGGLLGGARLEQHRVVARLAQLHEDVAQ